MTRWMDGWSWGWAFKARGRNVAAGDTNGAAAAAPLLFLLSMECCWSCSCGTDDVDHT